MRPELSKPREDSLTYDVSSTTKKKPLIPFPLRANLNILSRDPILVAISARVTAVFHVAGIFTRPFNLPRDDQYRSLLNKLSIALESVYGEFEFLHFALQELHLSHLHLKAAVFAITSLA